MRKTVLIIRIAIGVFLVAAASTLAVWVTRLPSIRAYRPALSGVTSVAVSAPTDGGSVFLNDNVHIDAQSTTNRPVDSYELWVNGAPTSRESFSVDGAGVIQSSASPLPSSSSPIGSDGVTRSFAFTFLWTPDHSGEYTLLVRAVGAGSVENSNAVHVSVVDPAALTAGPAYLPQAGETLNTLAGKFGLPALALGIVNPQIGSLDDPLPADQPVILPNLPPPSPADETASGPSSELPAGAKLDPPSPAPDNLRFWFDLNISARFRPAEHLPPAPLLFRSRDGCNVHLYIRDNSTDELGFYIYRLDPGASDFTRIATLGPHKGVAFIEYVDKGLYGNYQYYASAFNALGEAASDPLSIAFYDSGCATPDAAFLKLENLHLSLAGAADKAYCYYSTQAGIWSRLPADPNAFVYPTGGNDFDLGGELSGLQVLPAQTKLQFDCWGWHGGTLAPIGSGSTTLGSSSTGRIVLVQGNDYAITGSLGALLGPPIPHTLGEPPDPRITAPINLTRTAFLDTCVNHFPPALEFLGGLFCKASVDVKGIILVWDWSPELGTISPIDGYRVYKTYPGGKAFLIKTIPDSTQTVLIQDPEPAGKPVPCYFVRAFKGLIASPDSNVYCLAPADSGVDTVAIPPISLFTQDVLRNEAPGTFHICTEGLGGDATAGLADGQVAAGYEYTYDERRCTTWIDHFYRGRVVFDLSGLKGTVTNAVLEYKQADSDSKYFLFEQSCAASVNLVTGTSGDDATTWRAISDLPKLGMPGTLHFVDVTEAVQSWMLGEDPNLGLVLVGRDESLPEKIDDICWSRYGNFNLVVTTYGASK